MNCSEVLAEIEAYIDGELPSDRTVHLVDHLHSCSPCLDRADFQRKLKEIIGRKCHAAAETPEHLMVRVKAAIRSERPEP